MPTRSDPVPIDAIGLAFGYAVRRTCRIHPDDPQSAEAVVEQTMRHEREGWATRVDVPTRQRATSDTFIVSGRLAAYHDGRLVAQRDWNVPVPRRGI